MDEIDKRIVNRLQGGFPLTERPYRGAGRTLGIGERDLIERLGGLLGQGILSRFGPLYDAARIGGASCLCALTAPPARFEAIAALVNAHCEVAHNYERAHPVNMWFVLAVDRPERIDRVVAEIERETGVPVLTFPKIEEYFIGFQVEV
jgi:DNA-binding Lrp family transcriptional regulator